MCIRDRCARLRSRVGDLVFVQQGGELSPEASPVRSELLDPKRLEDSRSQPEVHVTWGMPRERLEGVGVEAQLQHVSRFALDPGQLRVNRLVRAVPLDGIVDSNQEVGDADVYKRQQLSVVALVGRYPANKLMDREPLPKRKNISFIDHAIIERHPVLAPVSRCYPSLRGLSLIHI